MYGKRERGGREKERSELKVHVIIQTLYSCNAILVDKLNPNARMTTNVYKRHHFSFQLASDTMHRTVHILTEKVFPTEKQSKIDLGT
jgi:hypothetical protein